MDIAQGEQVEAELDSMIRCRQYIVEAIARLFAEWAAITSSRPVVRRMEISHSSGAGLCTIPAYPFRRGAACG